MSMSLGFGALLSTSLMGSTFVTSPSPVAMLFASWVSMARQRARARPCPPISKLSLLCVAALLLLALFSIISGRFLDLDTWADPPPAPLPRSLETVVEEQSAESLDETAIALRKLQDVPGQWGTSLPHIWESENAECYYGCSEPSTHYESIPTSNNGYLFIAASGGLNQQRTGITDSVVVARLLNATLVVPHLDHRSYWKDNSNFSDIFDVDWFVQSVAPDVKVIKQLPSDSRKFLLKQLYSLRVPRKVTPHYYLTRILPILKRRHSIRLTKFDYRLANKLDSDLQKLRCRVNYKALRFTKAIQDMGQSLVDKMRVKNGKYIALHLRYESDMLAFSGCYYGGGRKGEPRVGCSRKRWKTLHYHNPEKERRNGKCPLTPEEVGLMLRALGYGNDTNLYVASGEVYNGEASLAPLKALFPNFYTKDTIASRKELRPFARFSSRMAAIDYIVCSQSNVFVANNNGNMARILAGERRFNGHKRTIRPNAKKLGNLFPARHNMSWEVFAGRVRHFQKGFMGDPMEVRPGRGEFHENPSACICEKPEAEEKLRRWKEKQGKKSKVEKVQEPVELQGVDQVIPVEDTLNDEEEGDEELPFVIDYDQVNVNDGDGVDDLLLDDEDSESGKAEVEGDQQSSEGDVEGEGDTAEDTIDEEN